MNQFNQQQDISFGKARPFIFIGVGILLLVIFWSKISVTIQPGYGGLLYKQFGGGIDAESPPMEQGFHFIAPWNNVTIYEIRQSETSETMTVLSSNLLDIKLDVTTFSPTYLQQAGKVRNRTGKELQK